MVSISKARRIRETTGRPSAHSVDNPAERRRLGLHIRDADADADVAASTTIEAHLVALGPT
jgi:hypothetical protein